MPTLGYVLTKELAHLIEERSNADFSPDYHLLINSYISSEFQKIPVKITHTDKDPYKSCEELTEDINKNNKMLIFTGGANNHPFLTTKQNLQFRAIHDWQHYEYGRSFTLNGECGLFSDIIQNTKADEIKEFLFSEIVLQACYFDHYDSFMETQKVVFAPAYLINKVYNLFRM